MSEEKKYLKELPPDFDFGGWETDRDKALWDLSFTPEERMNKLDQMIEFAIQCRSAVRVVRRSP